MTGPSGLTPNLQLPYPVIDDDADIPRDFLALATKLDVAGAVPVGSLIMWPTATPPSTDWLICAGQTNVLVASYPLLLPILGSVGGAGVYLLIPDFVGRIPIGPGAISGATAPQATSIALGAELGRGSVKLTGVESGAATHSHAHTVAVVAGGGSHGHTIQHGGNSATGPGVQGWVEPLANSGSYWGDTQGAVHNHTMQGGVTDNTTPTAASTSHDNMPPVFCVNFLIRAK